MARIGVEYGLTDVQAALQQLGHEVVQLRNESDAQGCDCCVVTGQDSNVMGISDAVTQGSVSGLTAEEICQQVGNKVQE
jgi:hypothetical protein